VTDPLERLRAALADKYAIQRELGAGGMATVYAAEDLKHRRTVAVKVLRPELAAVIGADRFLKEIEITANLQHPHILPLHDSGAADSFLYYVMPFVEGETLRDRLNREKQLPVGETVEMARAIASALDYAHRHGVVHRDIKPENILLHDGQALVADFGISLAVSQAGAGTRMTETGLSLGTPHYMSPEQATGDRALDARSDVYSLGCVVYEMLTGDPPHTGSTVQAIVAKVLSEQPTPIGRTRNLVPPNIDAAIQQALMKTPADRFGTAAEFAAALANPNFRLPGAETAAAAAGRGSVWNPVSIGGMVLAGVLLVTTLWGWLGRSVPEPGVSRQRIVLWKPTAGLYQVTTSTISPDGLAIVFPDTVGGDKLWIKTRNQVDPVAIAGTDGAFNAFFSPDGAWIGFTTADGKLKKIPVTGGAAIPLADSANTAYPAGAWLEDGSILFNNSGYQLRRIPAEGGRPVSGGATPAGLGVVAIQPLPGDRGALLILCRAGCSSSMLYLMAAGADSSHLLLDGVANAWYLPSGHLLQVRSDGGVLAAPFDLKTLALTGAGLPVLDGVRIAVGQADIAVSPRSGTILYATGAATQTGGLMPMWVDRKGVATPVDTAWKLTPGANIGLSISPDGSRLAINTLGEGSTDVWVKQLDQGPLTRLTSGGERNFRPMWTPDGRSVTYLTNRDSPSYDLYQRRADGSDTARKILDLEARITEGFWSSDGQWMVLRLGGTAGVTGDRSIMAIRPGVDSAPRPLIVDPKYDAKVVALSPDGRWLAYESTESGREQIYVRPFPDVGESKVAVSTAGGLSPMWSKKGRELFFLNAAREMVSVPYTDANGQFLAGEATVLFPTNGRLFYSANSRSVDVHPDGSRFIFLGLPQAAGGPTGDLILVEHWDQELKARLAAAK
jgi:eukaryotic-like serine/threonine-protein kinase